MARKDISMSEEEIGVLLAETRNLQVATMGADGFPHLTTLWFVTDGGRVVFRSFTKSQRIVNLRRDPRLTVLAEAGDGYDELRGVMVKGRAMLSEDPARVMEVYTAVLAKTSGTEPDRVAAEALFGRFADKNTVVEVEPVQVISWDHRKLGGGY